MSFVPHSDADQRDMLAKVGVSDVRELYSDVPAGLLLERDLDVPDALSEWEAMRRVTELAGSNPDLVCFAGGGMYDHYVPAAVDHIIRRSEFYTAYTPYQPEVAQGTLQVIYEFQTMICELTGYGRGCCDGSSSYPQGPRRGRAIASPAQPQGDEYVPRRRWRGARGASLWFRWTARHGGAAIFAQ